MTRIFPPSPRLRRTAVALAEAGAPVRVLLRKCDRLLTPRTCQAAIAPTTMNAKAAKVAKLSTTCNRETRDQLSRGSGSLRDLCGLCVHPCCTREGREPCGPVFMRRGERAPAHDDSVVRAGSHSV